MNPDYETARRELHEAYKRAIDWGVEPWRVIEALMRVRAEIESLNADRQCAYVRKVRTAGTRAIAARSGVSQRAVQLRFGRALNKLRNGMATSLRA